MKTLFFRRSSPVLLLDTSYFIFYRYFSTLKWFQFREPNLDYQHLLQHPVFVEAFQKHVLQDFKKMCKQWKICMSNIVLCCDCPREKIWRNDHHTSYKAHRVQSTFFDPNIFPMFYEYVDSHPEWGLTRMMYDSLEADDVVYLIKQKLAGQRVIIVTNDNDYLQMIDDQTTIFNITGKGLNLAKRSCGHPQKDLKIKIVMGDKSDNIEPIHAGIGPKTALKLVDMEESEFQNYLDTRGCREMYEKNKKLIDFTEIPKELWDGFQATYEIVIQDI